MSRNLSIETLLHKAKEELIDSDIALANDRLNNSINRSYYSMFHAATATVKQHVSGFDPSSHKAVLSNFNQYVVHHGDFDKVIAAGLRKLESARMAADYTGEEFDRSDVEEYNKAAHAFVLEAVKNIEAHKAVERNAEGSTLIDLDKLSSPGLQVGDIGEIMKSLEPNTKKENDDNDPEP